MVSNGYLSRSAAEHFGIRGSEVQILSPQPKSQVSILSEELPLAPFDELPGIERRGHPRQDLVTITHPYWSGCMVHSTSGHIFKQTSNSFGVATSAAPAA
jgi:hypothetical protein